MGCVKQSAINMEEFNILKIIPIFFWTIWYGTPLNMGYQPTANADLYVASFFTKWSDLFKASSFSGSGLF